MNQQDIEKQLGNIRIQLINIEQTSIGQLGNIQIQLENIEKTFVELEAFVHTTKNIVEIISKRLKELESAHNDLVTYLSKQIDNGEKEK